MDAPATRSSTLVAPGESRTVRAFGAELTFHLSGEQTEGRLMLASILAPPRSNGPPLHYFSSRADPTWRASPRSARSTAFIT
jgi:hypothetical protein